MAKGKEKEENRMPKPRRNTKVKVIYINPIKESDQTPKKLNEANITRVSHRQPWIKPRRNTQIEDLRDFILSGIKIDEYGMSYTYHEQIQDWDEFLIDESYQFGERMLKKAVRIIDLSDFDILERLCKASFGDVRLVFLRKIETYLAAKIIRRDRLKGKAVAQFTLEKDILKSIFFPFTLHLEFFLQDAICMYLIVPALLGGDMFTHLQRMDKLSEKASAFYSAQMVLAFEYLHNFNLLHRDLKPENILIDHLGYLKLTDFGASKIVQTRTYTLTGTPEYLAPEMIEHKGYGVSVDWWALGILIYELCSGYTPFMSLDRTHTFTKITKGKFNLPSYFSDDLCDLLRNLLTTDVSKRYGTTKNGVNDIKFHRWYNFIDWLSLVNRQMTPPYRPQLHSVHDTKYFSEDKHVAKEVRSLQKY